MATVSNNGPISVVNTTVNATTGVSVNHVILTTRYPFHKLDSTKTESFQVITLFFATEPPDPVQPVAPNVTTNKTLVYHFPHGYTYTPSSWFLVSLDGFKTTIGAEGAQIISGSFGTSSAYINIEVDSTNVNFYITKNWSALIGLSSPPHVIGFSISIRAYIFVEDLLGGSVPTSA